MSDERFNLLLHCKLGIFFQRAILLSIKLIIILKITERKGNFMQEIYYQSLTELLGLLKTKKLSCVELTRIFLNRIQEVNPKLKAVVDIQEEKSIESAQEADKAIANKQSLGKLHGLPVTIKDFCLVEGYLCTAGTQGWKNYKAESDSTCVNKLKKAGATILGITNVPELFTSFETENDLYGRTVNPYDFTKTPGGSSGGESSIIAAGGSPLGLGSDGGGSIRVPSHFTGIAGIKPTHGLLSRIGSHGLAHGLGWISGFSTAGPMARYVDDLDLALSVLAGHDIRDPFSVPVLYGDSKEVEIDKLRVAFYTDDGSVTPQDEIQNAVKEAAKLLVKQGASVAEKMPPGMQEAYELLGYYFFDGDGGQHYQSMLAGIETHDVSALQKVFLEKNKTINISTPEWIKILERIGLFKYKMHAFLESFDLIICPPCATTAKAHGTTFEATKDFNYTMTYNLTGWPAAVVRCGEDKNGLPLGVQIVGRPWQDHVVIAAAKLLENHFGGWRAAPGL